MTRPRHGPLPQPSAALSADGRVLTLTYTDGQRIVFTSSSTHGFTDEQVTHAQTYQPRLTSPGRHYVRAWVLSPRVRVVAGVETSPPTWWVPRARLGRASDGAFTASLGWLRLNTFLALEQRDRPGK